MRRGFVISSMEFHITFSSLRFRRYSWTRQEAVLVARDRPSGVSLVTYLGSAGCETAHYFIQNQPEAQARNKGGRVRIRASHQRPPSVSQRLQRRVGLKKGGSLCFAKLTQRARQE